MKPLKPRSVQKIPTVWGVLVYGDEMAKRFTDTAKWAKPWYRKLGPHGRDIFNYLIENCDSCGVWEIDLDVISFQLGTPITSQDIFNIFKDKYFLFDDNRKMFLTNFILHQYGGALSFDCLPHNSHINKLISHNLIDTLGEGLAKPFVTLTHRVQEEEEEKYKYKDKKKVKEKALIKSKESTLGIPIDPTEAAESKRIMEESRAKVQSMIHNSIALVTHQ